MNLNVVRTKEKFEPSQVYKMSFYPISSVVPTKGGGRQQQPAQETMHHFRSWRLRLGLKL